MPIDEQTQTAVLSALIAQVALLKGRHHPLLGWNRMWAPSQWRQPKHSEPRRGCINWGSCTNYHDELGQVKHLAWKDTIFSESLCQQWPTNCKCSGHSKPTKGWETWDEPGQQGIDLHEGCVLQNIHVSKLCVDLTTVLWTQSAVTACSKMRKLEVYRCITKPECSLDMKHQEIIQVEKPSAPKR